MFGYRAGRAVVADHLATPRATQNVVIIVDRPQGHPNSLQRERLPVAAAEPDSDVHTNEACMVDAQVAVGCGCRERIRGALSGFSFAVGILHAAATVEIGDPSTEQR